MGTWRDAETDWHVQNHCHCELCGRPLLGRAWLVEANGRTWTLCDAECEDLLKSYRLESDGATEAAAR